MTPPIKKIITAPPGPPLCTFVSPRLGLSLHRTARQAFPIPEHAHPRTPVLALVYLRWTRSGTPLPSVRQSSPRRVQGFSSFSVKARHPQSTPAIFLLFFPHPPLREYEVSPRDRARLLPLSSAVGGATPPTFPNLSPARFLPPHDLIIDRHASLVRPLNVVSTPRGFPDLPRHSNFAILATIPPRVYKSYKSQCAPPANVTSSRAFRGTIDRSDFGSAPAEPSRTASAEGEPRTPLTTGSVTPAADLPCQPLQREAHRVARHVARLYAQTTSSTA